MPAGRGVCAAVKEDVDGDLLQLCPCGGQVCAVLHPSSVQQLLPARRPGAAAVSPQRAARWPKKSAVKQQKKKKIFKNATVQVLTGCMLKRWRGGRCARRRFSRDGNKAIKEASLPQRRWRPQPSLGCLRVRWVSWPSACTAISRHTARRPSQCFRYRFPRTPVNAPLRWRFRAADTLGQCRHQKYYFKWYPPPPISLLCLCCAGLSVTVLPTDYPYWGGADAVLSVWAEERNHSLHVSG